MRAVLLLLSLLACGTARADCTATRWLDDFSTPPPLIDARNGQTLQRSQALPNGSVRTSLAKSWQLQAGAPPTVSSRLVVERGGTAPVTCWNASNLESTTAQSQAYCEFTYTFSGSVPLNGATKWILVTDHIGNDGSFIGNASGVGTPLSSVVRHGWGSHATIWTVNLEPAHISAAQLTSPIVLRWHPVAGPPPGTNIEHARWGVLRFGITDGNGACLPIQAPAEQPFPGPGYSALENDGTSLFAAETWQGNGRVCSTCHVPGDELRLTIASAQRPAADPLYWPKLGEREVEIRTTARVLAHSGGFGLPGNLTAVPRLTGLASAVTFGRSGTASAEDFIEAAIRDHMSFTSTFLAPYDFRAPSEWELAALAEFLRSGGR